MIIVADSSPLICFAILEDIGLLDKIFHKIRVPSAVFNELTIYNKPYSEQLRSYLFDKVITVKNTDLVRVLSNEIHYGESEAIALALEMELKNILIDDNKGRKVAYLNGLTPIGTLGSLLKAKQLNYIEKLKPKLDILIDNNIRIGLPLYEKALLLADE